VCLRTCVIVNIWCGVCLSNHLTIKYYTHKHKKSLLRPPSLVDPYFAILPCCLCLCPPPCHPSASSFAFSLLLYLSPLSVLLSQFAFSLLLSPCTLHHPPAPICTAGKIYLQLKKLKPICVRLYGCACMVGVVGCGIGRGGCVARVCPQRAV